MRALVFALCGLYVLIYGLAWSETATASMDAAGRGMAMGFLTVGIGFTLLFALPALILALLDKTPRLAVGLAIIPAAGLLLAMASGIV